MCVSVCKHLLSLPFKVAQGKGNRERDREGKKQRGNQSAQSEVPFGSSQRERVSCVQE